MTDRIDQPERSSTRRTFIHTAAIAAATGGAAALAWPLLDQMNPAADVVDQRVEYDLRKAPLGQQVLILWRSVPVLICHRTAEMIAAAERDDAAPLRDPERDEARVMPGHRQWLIVVATCTREHCTVFANPAGLLGWQCPCCGATYDASGRIRRGPAPKNLVAPSYEFLDENTVRIL